jgi:hypothetical protein
LNTEYLSLSFFCYRKTDIISDKKGCFTGYFFIFEIQDF